MTEPAPGAPAPGAPAPPAPAAVTPGIRKPENFTGENPEEFPTWLSKFDTIARAGGWDDENRKLRILPACLTGHAFQLYDRLAVDDKTTTFDALVGALEKKLGIGEKTSIWISKLRGATRKPGEKVDRFVGRLHNLARQAYPTGTEQERERRVNEQFMFGQPSDVRFHIMKSGTDDVLDKNVEMVKLYEAATEMTGVRRVMNVADSVEREDTLDADQENEESKTIQKLCAELESMRAAQREISENMTTLNTLSERVNRAEPRQQPYQGDAGILCYSCGQMGHMARTCPRGDRSTQKRNTQCFRCRRMGHISRDCPATPSSSVRRNDRPSREQCRRCGNRGHGATECRTDLTKVCQNCKKLGHHAAVCRSAKNEQAPTAIGTSGWGA